MSQSLPANDTQSIAPLVIQMLQAGLNIREMARESGIDVCAIRENRDRLIVEMLRAGRKYRQVAAALNIEPGNVVLFGQRALRRFEQRSVLWGYREIEGRGYFSSGVEKSLLRFRLNTLGKIELSTDERLFSVLGVGEAILVKIRNVINWERQLEES